MEKNRFSFLFMAALVFLSGGAAAQLGMTAGPLDFGELGPGENKTLSFGVFFAENKSMEFTVASPFPSMVLVEPLNGTLEPGSITWIKVTVKMPANESGSWQDFVRVRISPPAQP